jgi:hypothetical protein
MIRHTSELQSTSTVMDMGYLCPLLFRLGYETDFLFSLVKRECSHVSDGSLYSVAIAEISLIVMIEMQ